MSDTARLLLTIALLSGGTAALYVWNLARLDGDGPARLVGQLRLAQGVALLLAATGATSVGLAVAGEAVPASTLEVTLGTTFVIAAALVLGREPRDGLLVAAVAFVAHALTNIAHRPGLLSPDVAPRWFEAGSAIFDTFIAALCYLARRRPGP